MFEARLGEAGLSCSQDSSPGFVDCVRASFPHSKTIFSRCQVPGLLAPALSQMAQGLDLSGVSLPHRWEPDPSCLLDWPIGVAF